jgi:hypothetical protein
LREAAVTSETLVNFYEITHNKITEDSLPFIRGVVEEHGLTEWAGLNWLRMVGFMKK